MSRSFFRTMLSLAAAAALLVPVWSSAAEAGGNKSRKSNGEMMRLGGPSNGTGNGRMMRLGGPAAQPIDSGIYALPGRFVSNRSDDVRRYFQRLDEAGSGGGS